MATSRESDHWITSSSCEAVLFDLDGTIADTDLAHGMAYKMAFAEIGLSISETDFQRYSGQHSAAVIRGLSGGSTTIDSSILHESKSRHFCRLAPELVRPLPLLNLAFSLQGIIPIALVTSASQQTVKIILDSLAADVSFDVLVTADDVNSYKPDPQPYVLACARLGVPPLRCLAFEDSSSGVLSAEAAGVCVVRVHRSGVVRGGRPGSLDGVEGVETR